MFGSMKKAMAVAAVAAVGVVAPAVASADQWTVGGAPYSGPAELQGQLTTTLTGNGSTTTCDVALKVDLDNGAAGGVAQGGVRDYLFGADAGGSCTTSLPNCAPSFTVYAPARFPSLPLPAWPVTTSGQNVTVSGISYIVTYSNNGGSCPLAGVPLSVSGSMTGSAFGELITFDDSPGLTMSLGPMTTSGSLGAYTDGAGRQPIALAP